MRDLQASGTVVDGEEGTPAVGRESLAG
jgi:trehalose 6-phosphate synthase